MTTPLTFNLAGEGWHLAPRRLRWFRFLLVAGLVVLAVATLIQVLAGSWLTAAILALLTLAIAPHPFAKEQPLGLPTLEKVDGEHGLVLRVRQVSGAIVFSLGLFGGMLAAGGGFGIVVGAMRHDVGAVVGSVLILAFSGVFVLGVVGSVRARRTSHHGILLLPDAVVVRTTRVNPRLDWSEIAAIRAHWRRGTRVIPQPDDEIRNWLTFVPREDVVWPADPMRALSGTPDPSVSATQLGVPPYAALSLLQFYLANPEARDELRDSRSLARFDHIARSMA